MASLSYLHNQNRLYGKAFITLLARKVSALSPSPTPEYSGQGQSVRDQQYIVLGREIRDSFAVTWVIGIGIVLSLWLRVQKIGGIVLESEARPQHS